jgi:hypothetical protein
MKLYHGTKKQLDYLEAKQAVSPYPNEIPKDEILEAVYLTPDYGRAIAMGSRPEGNTIIDDENHKITFENPELFDPNQDIYIYNLDSEIFPLDELKPGENGLDYVAMVKKKLIVPEVKKVKAREVLDYYELTNWKENKEIKEKISNSFRVK